MWRPDAGLEMAGPRLTTGKVENNDTIIQCYNNDLSNKTLKTAEPVVNVVDDDDDDFRTRPIETFTVLMAVILRGRVRFLITTPRGHYHALSVDNNNIPIHSALLIIIYFRSIYLRSARGVCGYHGQMPINDKSLDYSALRKKINR